MNIANKLKDRLTVLTKIHYHNTQTKYEVCELKEEAGVRKEIGKQ